MSKSRSVLVVVAAVIALVALTRPALAQITTGSVGGTVTDAQGGVIPGATVVLISETQGTKSAPAVTNGSGQYSLPNIKADTYTVEVTMSNFKTLSRKGVKVSGGDRVAVEALVLQVGGASETVNVLAEAPVIKSASGERSDVIAAAQLENLPMTSHNFQAFLTVVPGVDGTSRIGGGGQSNYMIDGISAMDTGNNGLMGGLNLSVDAIQEVKVITSGYAAEYGRSSGLQVSAVTRGGTNRFRGALFDYERNSDWNSNSWANLKNGTAKGISKQRDWGYSIGGPIGKPGGNNKLFFFYAHEYRPRTTGGNTTNLRMPTALERRGDFSETRDNNGNLYNLIYDPNTGLAKTSCAGAVTTACFADGGVLGRIPINRLYGPGIAILNQYPLPNVTQITGQAYNWTNVSPVQATLSYSPTVRGDYQASSKLRVTAKWDGTSARILPNIGSIPGFNDTIQQFPLSFNTSGTANYSLTNSTFIEVTYGMNQNRLGTPPIGELSNRNNVKCPSDLAAQISNCTLGAIGFLFPDAGAMNPAYYETKALATIGVPFLQNNVSLLPPLFSWAVGGTTSRVSNNTCNGNNSCAPPNLSFPGFMNINRTQDVAISLTRVAGSHTFKAGFYLNHSYKAQNFGAGGNGAPSFQGALAFGQDTNNPIEAGFPYADAALGVYSSYGQQSNFIEGSFLYNNVDWYLQDNWKLNRKLTLDYGVRFVHQQPQYDQFRQVANFFEDKWTLASAPYLYAPGCAGNVNPCSGNNRQAKDPRTGTLLGVGSSSLIGSVILGSGNSANGMIRAGDGIAKTGYVWPWLGVAPRVGGAYDITGKQKIIVRGSVGLFFDRPDGNSVFSTVGNPPVATSSQAQWGLLSALSNPQFAFGPVPILNTFNYDAALPKDTQWNGGVQMALPWASAVDVSYVGHYAADILSNVNLNTIDLGTTTSLAGQDPTQAAGTALPNNLLRSFRGYGNLNRNWGRFHRTFHSVQTSFTRRFKNGVSFGVNWTVTLKDFATTGLPGPIIRLNHNADGTYTVRPDQATAEKLFGDQGTTTHIVLGNFVWDLPDVKGHNKVLKGIGLVVNDWQLSGIMRIDSGDAYDVGYSYQSGGGTNLTGSPDYTARIVIPNLSAIGGGCSGDQYSQFNNKMVAATGGVSPVRSNVFSGPQPGSVGLESGRNLLYGCPNHIMDLSIVRNIRVGGARTIVLRADLYNAFNTVVFTGRSSTIQFNSPTDLTVRNSQYLADGTLDPARLRPNQAGFGAVNAAAGLRSVQGQIRFTF